MISGVISIQPLSVEEQMNSLGEEDKFDWKEIFSLFHRPDVHDAEIKFSRIDKNKIKKILVEKHDFSEERVDRQLEKLEEMEEQNKQKDLNKWF